MDKMDNQQLISALADGQLQGEELARGVEAATADARAREAWCAYHVVGEVLRTGQAAVGTPHEAFLQRLQQRLKQEPRPARVQGVGLAARAVQPAVNDRVWKLAAGFASVAAVAAIGWNVWTAGVAPATQPQMAAAPAASAPEAIEASAATMVRDPRLDQFLAAHRQLGGATALQATSGFLRNATFQAPAGR